MLGTRPLVGFGARTGPALAAAAAAAGVKDDIDCKRALHGKRVPAPRMCCAASGDAT